MTRESKTPSAATAAPGEGPTGSDANQGRDGNGQPPSDDPRLPRSISGGGVAFCWQDKAALRLIREVYDDQTCLAQALAVYCALTEISSNAQSPTFTVKKRIIAGMAGVSLRLTGDILGTLRRVNLLDWIQNRVDGSSELSASTYTLLSCTPCTTPCTPCTRSCTVQETGSVPSSKKNIIEEHVEVPPAAPVELPAFFPKDEAAAAKHASAVGCPVDFAVQTWTKAMGRGGRDARDVLIRNFRWHLAAEWSYQRERAAKQPAPAKPNHDQKW